LPVHRAQVQARRALDLELTRAYLTRFPLSRIKIDRSFVRKVPEDTNAAAIVRSLIVMAHNLGLEVIAEGVETQAQAAFLLGEGCEKAQRFLYGGPFSATDFEKYFASATAHRQAGSAPAQRISEMAARASREEGKRKGCRARFR
jgi:predicted signal transduction protein with EAL and GGDEF domain